MVSSLFTLRPLKSGKNIQEPPPTPDRILLLLPLICDTSHNFVSHVFNSMQHVWFSATETRRSPGKVLLVPPNFDTLFCSQIRMRQSSRLYHPATKYLIRPQVARGLQVQILNTTLLQHLNSRFGDMI